VVQGAHPVSGDRDLAHVEELDLGQWAAGHLLQDLHGVRPLHLEAVQLPLAGRVDGRALVALEGHVVAAGLAVVLHPVVRGGAPDDAHSVLLEVEEDRVADHVAVRVADDELLRLVHREILERVHGE
jgi:hypothetical protein